MKKDSLDPKLGSDICGLVARICMAEPEDLLEAREDLTKLIGSGYYEGDGDRFMNEALSFINSKLKINWVKLSCGTHRIIAFGKTYGLFYDSKSKLRHIAQFIPYEHPPYVTLCGNRFVNFVGTGSEDNICCACEKQLFERLNDENL